MIPPKSRWFIGCVDITVTVPGSQAAKPDKERARIIGSSAA